MDPLGFKYLYLAGVVLTYLVRISGVAESARNSRKEDNLSPKDKIKREGVLISVIMLFWFASSQVLPVIYTIKNSFSFAKVSRPVWLGILGIVIFIFALWLLWRAHHDLGKNWSSTVQIRSEQSLVTQGIYRFLRHPIYTAHILWGVAQAFMLPNWLAGWGGLLFIIPVFLIRIPNEEKTMINQFGETYIEYMEKVGGVLPKLRQEKFQS
jgi:protein-S-isoprenylcysteine O-methyltransferase Ste14